MTCSANSPPHSKPSKLRSKTTSVSATPLSPSPPPTSPALSSQTALEPTTPGAETKWSSEDPSMAEKSSANSRISPSADPTTPARADASYRPPQSTNSSPNFSSGSVSPAPPTSKPSSPTSTTSSTSPPSSPPTNLPFLSASSNRTPSKRSRSAPAAKLRRKNLNQVSCIS